MPIARRGRAAREARARRASHGLRPPHLQGPRPARRRARGGGGAHVRARRRRAAVRAGARGRDDGARAARGVQARAGGLKTNVEFYTALLLHGLELDTAFFTPTFAVGRVAGWTAHCFEQRALGRLIRPQSAYVGRIPVSASRNALDLRNARAAAATNGAQCDADQPDHVARHARRDAGALRLRIPVRDAVPRARRRGRLGPACRARRPRSSATRRPVPLRRSSPRRCCSTRCASGVLGRDRVHEDRGRAGCGVRVRVPRRAR